MEFPMQNNRAHADLIGLRKRVLSHWWPLDDEIVATSKGVPSHRFLENPSGQYAYVYLTHYVKAFAEQHFGIPFSEMEVLDWGCGKGHVSKLFRNLGPGGLESCDIQSDKNDSTFGQQTPILERFHIPVTPLTHSSLIPYPDESFHIVVSFGVLEHVADDAASIAEITRILKPNGLFFCFFLPTKLSWTQKLSRAGGNSYHDRLYTRQSINALLQRVNLQLRDCWYRQLFPKNSITYPAFRVFEQIDQLITRYTFLRYFATNIEFVAVKPERVIAK
jgi:ubiquinone/menaquinone biosynthesis C-methylase UbiE